MNSISYGLLIALAIALVFAAFTDMKRRQIDNWLNAAIALGAPVFWWASGLSLWPDVAIQLGVALAAFAVFAGMFALRMMGGGDVKLLTVLALWVPPYEFLQLLAGVEIQLTRIAGACQGAQGRRARTRQADRFQRGVGKPCRLREQPVQPLAGQGRHRKHALARHRLRLQTGLGFGAAGYVRSVLSFAFGDDKAQTVLSRIGQASTERPLEILDWMDAPSIAELLADEHRYRLQQVQAEDPCPRRGIVLQIRHSEHIDARLVGLNIVQTSNRPQSLDERQVVLGHLDVA